jgi:hypothetical protein
MEEFVEIIENRIKQIFDEIQENPSVIEKDYVFLNFCQLLLNKLENIQPEN